MDADGFFRSTIPVFQHYTDRLDILLSRLPDERTAVLSHQLAPDGFSAGEHFRTAQGFVVRAVFPLIGQTVPDLSTESVDAAGLRQRSREVREILSALTPENFERAATRAITHQAGQATVTQDAMDFLTLFALPNFFFHLTMGYATLRQQGVEIGKADFDGLHSYPKGFRFSD